MVRKEVTLMIRAGEIPAFPLRPLSIGFLVDLDGEDGVDVIVSVPALDRAAPGFARVFHKPTSDAHIARVEKVTKPTDPLN